MEKYVNLHGHSTYSILDSVGYPGEIVKRAKEIGFKSIAITDHGNMNMVADLYLSAKEHDIKPIFGVEAYFIESLEAWKQLYDELSTSKKSLKDDRLRKYNHLILLAKNEEGLKNLYKLCFYGQRDGQYYKPRIDKKLLTEYSKGIICSAACIMGVAQRKIISLGYLEKKSYEDILNAVKDDILFFKNLFKEDFYFEIQINELEEQKFCNSIMLRLAKEFNIKTIITNDSHYIKKEHNNARDVMMMIREKITSVELEQQEEEPEKNEKKEESLDCRELYLKTSDELKESAKRLKYDYLTDEVFEELFKNTLEIDEKIENIKIDTSTKLIRPSIGDIDSFEYLKKYCHESLQKKADKHPYIRNLIEDYKNRLEYELSVIKQKEIYDYFLVMKEIIDYAKTQMLTGVGRGSAAGALICYLLDITKVDPLKYQLLFFRFINLARKELPDIDTDFEDPEIVKTHLFQKFGDTNVAYVSTYGTYQMKALLKDYCRAFGITEEGEDKFFYANKLTNIIEHETNAYQGNNEENENFFLTYEDYLAKSPTFKAFVTKNKEAEEIIRILYGQIRQIGKHAAGTIIVDDLLSKMPLQCVKGKVQTPYTEGLMNKNLGKMGFVKFDLLGLNTLKIINDALKLIAQQDEAKHNELLEQIHPDNIDFSDLKVYKTVFHDGNFLGVFQFSEQGMQALCKQIIPTRIEELSDIVALFRPGPLANGFHMSYIKRKFKREDVSYLDETLKSITERTHGLLIYQEQIMQAGMKLGKLAEAESNELRKLLVKLDKTLESSASDKLVEFKNKFIIGAKENNCTEEKATEIWDIMERFSGYAFNLSHSLCYAITAFQCAWLKTYYPLQFYCSLLTNTKDANDYESIISEMNKLKINILPPDINDSKDTFVIRNNNLLFALRSIQGIGEKTTKDLIDNQPYNSFEHFISKKTRAINKKVISALTHTNCFSKFNSIGELMEKYPQYSQVSLDSPYLIKELSKIERSLLKANVSFVSKEEKRKVDVIQKFISQGKVTNFKLLQGTETNFYGLVRSVEKKKTKNNKDMVKVRLEDLNRDQITLIIFEQSLRGIEKNGHLEDMIPIDEMILFTGKVSEFQNNKLLNLDKLYNFKKIVEEIIL